MRNNWTLTEEGKKLYMQKYIDDIKNVDVQIKIEKLEDALYVSIISEAIAVMCATIPTDDLASLNIDGLKMNVEITVD